MRGMATMACALLIAAAAMSAAVGAARRNEDCDLYGMNCEGPPDTKGESFLSRSEEISELQTDDTEEDTEEGELSATHGVSSKQRMFSLAQQKMQQAKNMVKASSKMTADALKAVHTIQQQLVNKATTGETCKVCTKTGFGRDPCTVTDYKLCNKGGICVLEASSGAKCSHGKCLYDTGSTVSLFCMPDTLRYKYGTQDGSPWSKGKPEDNWPYCEKKIQAKYVAPLYK